VVTDPDRMPPPPRAAEALLSFFLPAGGIRESVLGDLHEMYGQRWEEAGSHSWAARRWYWTQSVRLSLGYGLRRVRGRRYRGFAPAPRPGEVKRGMARGDGMAGIVRQIRLSLRSLLRSPGFTFPSLLILAIGMTAATAIFTIVDSVVFRPLDLPDSHRLVIVCEDHPRMGGACIASPANTEDFRQGSSTLAELGIVRGWPYALTDDQGSEGVRGGIATAGFWRAVGVRPVLGRLFTDAEYGADDDDVAILSHAFWTSHYGGDEDVLGRLVSLSGETVRIVGVLPPGFDLPLDLGGIEVWRPPHFSPLDPEIRRWRGFRAIGRLVEGSSVAAASAELTGIYSGLRERYEEVNDEWRLRVEPLLRVVVGDTRPVLLAFLAAAGLLLLIVCANVANLLLARGLGRRQELAVRAAMGAERTRLVREILVESLVLSGLAAGFALLLSTGAVRALLALAPPGIPRLDEVTLDGRVLLFTLLLSAAATMVFAALPALRVTSWNLGEALKSSVRSGDLVRSTRLQSGLVLAELALSVVLLSSAALLTRSFMEYLKWDPGFDPEPLLAVSAFLDPGKYTSRGEFVSVFRQVEESMEAIPGVVSATSASAGPLFGGGDGATPFEVEGIDPSAVLPTARWYDIGPGYFSTLGLPMVRGRELTEDDVEEGPRVAVVNESLARRAWPEEDPLGRTIRLPELDLSFQVVGVVTDAQPMVPGEAPYPEIYWSNRQLGRVATFFLVRAASDPTSVADAVIGVLKDADPDVSLGTPFALTRAAERELVQPRFQALILITFALMALILSAVGVYAVVSYAVARRTREVGIRVALGARANDVITLMARTSLAIAVVGILLGLAGSLLTGRLIERLIPGVSPADAASLATGALTLLLVAALAVFAPARRATRVDPLEAMRVE
jgi:putative ABC transport system permease protein